MFLCDDCNDPAKTLLIAKEGGRRVYTVGIMARVKLGRANRQRFGGIIGSMI